MGGNFSIALVKAFTIIFTLNICDFNTHKTLSPSFSLKRLQIVFQPE